LANSLGNPVTITEVYFSPDAHANLLSNAVFDSKGGETRIENGVVEFFTKNDELFLRGLKRGSLYEMELSIGKTAQHVQNEEIDLAEPEGFCGI
jgi:hypothetical protein